MKVFAYCRVSTKHQSLERQIRNIKSHYPEAIIITEKYTATTIDRPQWLRLMEIIKASDKIVFDSVSRMSRNAEEGFIAYENLYNMGVELIFLKEPHINTSVFRDAVEKSIPMTGTSVDLILEGINKYLLELAKNQICIAFQQSEKEVIDLHTRIKEGIITAKLNNKRIGLPKGSKLTTQKSIKIKDMIKKYSKDFDGSLGDADCIKLIGCARNTFYKYKKNQIIIVKK